MVTVMMMKAMMITCSSLMLLGQAAAQERGRYPTYDDFLNFDYAASLVPTPPRLKVSYTELQEQNGVNHFEVEGSCCYSALLLDEERGRLFVGAKDFLLSLWLENISDHQQMINWHAPMDQRKGCTMAGKDLDADCVNFIKILHNFNQTHLFACGTGAYKPTCTYVKLGTFPEDNLLEMDPSLVVDGRGKAPYNDTHQFASVLVGEELFSGVPADIIGHDFAIFRSLGKNPLIRTDKFNSNWLNEPKFVQAFWDRENDNPDDDKIYFFFSERATEVQGEVRTYSRVAQICQNDIGGEWSLKDKWTTFLKARLVCSVKEDDGRMTYFDELQDVFMLDYGTTKTPHIFGVFTTTSSSVFRASAVCEYSMKDIREAFQGPFTHKEGPNCPWLPYKGKVPQPRPGKCPSKTLGSFESTKSFPEDMLQFAQTHPLMHNPVHPFVRQPLFVRANVNYSFTQIAVELPDSPEGRHFVMFIGTDKGTVLKVLITPHEDTGVDNGYLMEELEVFKNASPITNMVFSSKRQQLYVSSDVGLAQVPAHRCSSYGKSCVDCYLARDPYCIWDGTSCTRYDGTISTPYVKPSEVQYKYLDKICSEDLQRHIVTEKTVVGVQGSSTFLECISRFPRAVVTWTVQKGSNSPENVRIGTDILQTDRGLVLLSISKEDAGIYECNATDLNHPETLQRIKLEVIPWYSLAKLQKQ